MKHTDKYAGALMKTGVTVGLIFLFAVKAVFSIPTLLFNLVGLGFKDEFTAGNKTIKRPAHFKTRAHKAAFENVGQYVTNAMTRDVMMAFQDRALAGDSFLRPSNVPLEVWHDVLEFFEAQGFIERRWEMRLMHTLTGYTHSTHTYRSDVSWGPNGESLQEAPKDSSAGGAYRDSTPFTPSFLTDAQKQSLLGTQYALNPTSSLAWQKKEQEYTTLTEDDFECVYWRQRSLFTNDEKLDAAKKMAEIIILSQS